MKVNNPSQAAVRVLVIDDEPMIVRSIRRALHGVEVVAAHSGNEALGILQLHTDFDLLLCDLMMPDMTGMDVHAEVLKRSPELEQRMVFMTGGALVKEVDDFLDADSAEQLLTVSMNPGSTESMVNS